eukprot:scaffold3190_cov409-Prasinococcus_capsulatus_cf.AAC.15
MDRLEHRQLVVGHIDTDRKEKPRIASVNHLVSAELEHSDTNGQVPISARADRHTKHQAHSPVRTGRRVVHKHAWARGKAHLNEVGELGVAVGHQTKHEANHGGGCPCVPPSRATGALTTAPWQCPYGRGASLKASSAKRHLTRRPPEHHHPGVGGRAQQFCRSPAARGALHTGRSLPQRAERERGPRSPECARHRCASISRRRPGGSRGMLSTPPQWRVPSRGRRRAGEEDGPLALGGVHR